MLSPTQRRRVRAVLAGLFVAGLAPVVAQVPAGPGAPAIAITVPPLLDAAQAADRTAGETELNARAAQQALELGFTTAARQLFTELLASAATPAAREAAALGLASVEIAEEQPDAAEAALARAGAAGAPRVRLRRAMIALLRKNLPAAVTALDGLAPDDVPAEESAWVFVAQGWLANLQYLAVQRRADDASRRGQTGESQRLSNEAMTYLPREQQAYAEAARRLRSEQARARLEIAQQRVRLANGLASIEAVRALERTLERFNGQDAGFETAEALAVMLNQLDRADDARRLLQRQLPLVPAEKRALADRMRLLLVMIAGPETPTGVNELRRLLAEAVDPAMRRNALELFAGTATNRDRRERLRAELDARVGETPASPILEDLLFYRARLALDLKDFARAEEDARQLLAQYPGSALRVPAQFLLVESAWVQGNNRTAADALARLLGEPTLDAAQRGAFAVLQAEAAFRAGDFRSAATAYGTAAEQARLPAGATRGGLLFQQVLALMRAENAEDTPAAARFADTTALLDRLAGDAGFDVVSRWQAEWNLAKTMQVRGQSAAAYERVNRLVAANGVAALPAELALRMAWLQAKLSLEAGRTDATLAHVERLLAGPAGAGNTAVDAGLRDVVASAAGLLRAQAWLAAKPAQVEQATAELARVRRQFPASDAAIYSYIVMAGYYASVGNQTGAQNELQVLVDRHGDSDYAPFAYYQLAWNARLRGSGFYDDAYNKLEELVKKYPRDPLVFYARMRQGELLRLLSNFGHAESLYASLVKDFPNHPQRPYAELELAHTLFGQSGNDNRALLDRASSLFQRLFDSPSAPYEVRVEAGYMLGYVAYRRGDSVEARATWWKIADRFLLDERAAPKVGELGRYWIARSLSEYASRCEEEKRPNEARRAYELIVAHGLTGEHTARVKLGLGAAPAPTVPAVRVGG